MGSWSCWRGNWGTASLRASPQDSGNGPGERANDFVECVFYHINVTSVAGRIACSPLAPYTASKYALEALSEALAQEVKPFGIRVAIVQPGIIDTAMARRIEEAPIDAAYPQVRRFGHMFEASLEKPTPPTIVAEKIREIIESGTQKLRHPVGPDAEGFSQLARFADR